MGSIDGLLQRTATVDIARVFLWSRSSQGGFGDILRHSYTANRRTYHEIHWT